jgi:phage FluMu protein Com
VAGKITFRCDSCEKQIRVSASHAGKRGKCPHCKERVRIPEADEDDDDAPVLRAKKVGRDAPKKRRKSRGGARGNNRLRGGDEEDQIDRAFEKLKKVASLAGCKVQDHPGGRMLAAGFELGGGRRQVVYMSYMGQTPDGKDIVSFMSPALEMKKGLLSGVSKKMALDLLKRNPHIPFGSFGIHTMDGMDLIMVSSNQIVDTMDVEEFDAHIQCVALVADEYEREHGQDNF